MYFSTCALLALATGFASEAVAAPSKLHAREPEALPEYKRETKRQLGQAFSLNAAQNNNGNNNGFNFGNSLNQFNNQEQVVQVKQQNLQIVDNGQQQAVIEQTKEVLVVDQRNNNGFNDLFRRNSCRRRFNDKSTVMLVVQQVNVAIDDGRGNVIQQQVFAQSAVVANRGRRETQTVMIFDERQLVATQVLGGFGNGRVGAQPTAAAVIGGNAAAGNGSAPAATQSADVALFKDKPTWSSVVADPAATLGADFQAELQDAQNSQNNANDNNINAQAAKQEGQQDVATGGKA